MASVALAHFMVRRMSDDELLVQEETVPTATVSVSTLDKPIGTVIEFLLSAVQEAYQSLSKVNSEAG